MPSVASADESVDFPLESFFKEHYLLERDLCSHARELMQLAIRSFAKFLGARPTLADLNDVTLNRFLTALLDTKLSRSTIKGHRARLLALWNSAWQAPTPMVSLPPRRVKVVKVPQQIVDTWSESELVKLLDAARRLEGCFRRTRVSRSGYWTAIIATAYETGLRTGDLQLLRFDDIQADGRLEVIQHKTGKPITHVIRAETQEAIRAIQYPKRERIFGGVIIAKKNFMTQFRALVKDAGIKQGTFRWLRRASGTYVEKIAPGRGHEHLGNRRDVFLKHYAAAKMIETDRPLPPPLPSRKGQRPAKAPGIPACNSSPIMPLSDEFVLTLPASYQSNAKVYLSAICSACGMQTVGDLSATRIAAFVAKLDVSENTRRDYRQCMTRFVGWLVERGIHGAAAEALGELVGQASKASRRKAG